MARLAQALEASWDGLAAYRGVTLPNNPAYGQCYPTSRVVQYFYPETEIVCGEVCTGAGIERHFWNVIGSGAAAEWIDLSWQQFPAGSAIADYRFWIARAWATVPRPSIAVTCCCGGCWRIWPSSRPWRANPPRTRSGGAH